MFRLAFAKVQFAFCPMVAKMEPTPTMLFNKDELLQVLDGSENYKTLIPFQNISLRRTGLICGHDDDSPSSTKEITGSLSYDANSNSTAHPVAEAENCTHFKTDIRKLHWELERAHASTSASEMQQAARTSTLESESVGKTGDSSLSPGNTCDEVDCMCQRLNASHSSNISLCHGPQDDLQGNLDDIYQVLGRDVLKSTLLEDIDLYLECDDDNLYVVPETQMNHVAKPVTLLPVQQTLMDQSSRELSWPSVGCAAGAIQRNASSVDAGKTQHISIHKECKIRISFPPLPLIDDRFRCDQCSYSCTRKTVLLDHKSQNHGMTGLFVCPHCKYEGKLLRHLQKHMRRQHGEKISSRDGIPESTSLASGQNHVSCISSNREQSCDSVDIEQELQATVVRKKGPGKIQSDVLRKSEGCLSQQMPAASIGNGHVQVTDIPRFDCVIGNKRNHSGSMDSGGIPSGFFHLQQKPVIHTESLNVIHDLQISSQVEECSRSTNPLENSYGDQLLKNVLESSGNEGAMKKHGLDQIFTKKPSPKTGSLDMNSAKDNCPDSTVIDSSTNVGGIKEVIYITVIKGGKIAIDDTLGADKATSEGLSSMSCDICQKTFPYQASLKAHILTHKKKRLHKCKVCSKRFKMRCTLNEHIRRLHGPKVYHCKNENCSEKFALERDLRAHSRVHEKPYSCSWPQCFKRFSTRHNCSVHQRTHSGENSLHCKHCSFSCKEEESLDIHMKRRDKVSECK